MNYIQEISCEIIDFINNENKRCLKVICDNSKNIQQIIQPLDSDYVFTDLFYNVRDEIDLLFLIRQQRNPNKRPLEYDTFINPIKTVNVSKILSAAINIFKSDTASFIRQIVKELKAINCSRLCIMIDCNDGINVRLASIIHDICINQSLSTKFILIGSKDSLNNNYLNHAEYLQKMSVEFSLHYLKQLLPKLTEDQINSLKIASNNNLKEMRNLYDYLAKNTELEVSSDSLLQDIVETSLTQNYDKKNLVTFSIAAHLIESFSLYELDNIINGQGLDNIIIEDIESTLNNGVSKGILEETHDNIYEFVVSIVKNALKNIRSKQQKDTHLAIESYLAKKRPFAYDLRYYHLQEANSREKNRIITIQFFNKLHFDKTIDNETITRFTEICGEFVTNGIINLYQHIREGEYESALKTLSKIDFGENKILQSEMRYAEAYLIWKTVDKKDAIKLLKRKFSDIYNDDCEIETIIFTKLLQLSIISNEGEYSENTIPTPYSLYNEIKQMLIDIEDVDAQFLLNILRRKSNCALSRVSALNQIRESFEFFSLRKEYYPYEYFYAGTNYTALLLQSTTNNKEIPIIQNDNDKIYECRNAVKVAESLNQEAFSCNKKIQAYILNNYLIAKALSNESIIQECELELFESLLSNISIDSNIMFNMNLGTFYAMLNNFTKATRYWEIAYSENNHHDAYFNYIIENNLFIASLLTDKSDVAIPDTIPMLVSNDIEVIAYLKNRSAILKSLKEHKIRFCSMADANTYFESEFSKIYNNMQLKIWSTPFLFSDVQFWSDN